MQTMMYFQDRVMMHLTIQPKGNQGFSSVDLMKILEIAQCEC